MLAADSAERCAAVAAEAALVRGSGLMVEAVVVVVVVVV
jgi:hypothetical protein